MATIKIHPKVKKVAGQDKEEKKNQGLVEGLVERLVESQKIILDLVKKLPSISKKELAGHVGISETAVDKNIAQLKKKGLLKRIGPDKGGHWEIRNKS
jgi:ATP-dependent DNA helicase RecG